MNKNLRKIGLFLALVMTSTLFNSCKKDDKISEAISSANASNITATNIINSSNDTIVKVKAVVFDEYDNESVFGEGAYKNNSFTLQLSSTIANNYLRNIVFLIDGVEGVTVSDSNCMFNDWIAIFGYNDADVLTGSFYYESEETINQIYDWAGAGWLYVDRDVTVKGEDVNQGVVVDLTLKKGWNNVYNRLTVKNENGVEVYTVLLTSKKPSGVNFQWEYYSYNNNTAINTLKSAKNLKFFSSIVQEVKKK